MSSINIKQFQKRLQTWYQKNHRKLPWRSNPSLYKTVVSEFMLQQTQVDTMLPYFSKWLQSFPDFKTLASSSEEEVLKHWEGLGYYSRARNLHKLAKEFVTRPTLPTSVADWLEFPGVGPYTAAAITSIALDQPEAVVDGNVIRILARLTATTQEFKDNNTAMKYFTPFAYKILNNENPNSHNQAMMELGATICTKANPRCDSCPVSQFCEAKAQGIAISIPKLFRKKTVNLTLNRLYIVHKNFLLLSKTASNSKRLANMYELPKADDLVKNIHEHVLIVSKKRSITHHRIQENIYSLSAKPDRSFLNKIKASRGLTWIHLTEINSVTLSGPHRRWVTELSEKLS